MWSCKVETSSFNDLQRREKGLVRR
jgi:hypothetical protein